MLSIAFISPKAAYCMIGRMAKLADDQREAAIVLVAKLKIVGMRRCIFDIADERQRSRGP